MIRALIVHGRQVALSLSLLALTACAPGRPRAIAGVTDDLRIPWEPGTYRLRGVLAYRDDSSTTESTRRVPVVADLSIGPDGPLELTTPEGPCLLRPRVEVHEGYEYDCRGTLFTIFRRQELQARATRPVTEVILRPRTCVESGPDTRGQWICLKYERPLTSRMRDVVAILDWSRSGNR